MDPNETLSQMLEAATAIQIDEDENTEDAVKLAGLVQALSGWLHNEGFLPEYWARPAKPETLPEQLFEVRLLTEDNQALTVGRYYSYASALAHAKRTKERGDSLSRIDCTDVVVVPVVVLP
ncbi:MAG: hypothetical protein WC986_15030 [Elusimicrobiota bacterium]|jgi:hypothetical protein